MVIAAIVVVLLFVFVYGGDTGKAKDLVKESDAIMTKLNSKGDELGTSLNDLLKNIKTVSSVSNYEQMADEVRQQTGSIRSDLDSASKGYKQILEMNGVRKYKEYAKEVRRSPISRANSIRSERDCRRARLPLRRDLHQPGGAPPDTSYPVVPRRQHLW